LESEQRSEALFAGRLGRRWGRALGRDRRRACLRDIEPRWAEDLRHTERELALADGACRNAGLEPRGAVLPRADVRHAGVAVA
jgi:hypothetical protein